MKKWLSILLALVLTSRVGANVPALGYDSVSAEWFRQWYQHGDLHHYLDNLCNYSTYQAEQSGQWAEMDPLIFSIHGNSYRWNKYYLGDFRIDSRLDDGSTLYHLDMTEHTLLLDYHRSALRFYVDSTRLNRVSLTGNAGGIGGVARSAVWVQELLHLSAIHRLHPDNNENPIRMRRHIIGSGGVESVFGIEAFGKTYYQHVYGMYLRRVMPCMDYQGIYGMREADNLQVQLDGEIPMKSPALTSLNYILIARHRGDAYSELRYNDNEQAVVTQYNASLYAKKHFTSSHRLTAGLTWEMNDVRHRELCFTRNLIDQDGEGFEPWYADGRTHSLSLAVDYRLPILPWLDFHIDSYNSLLHFDPTESVWHNDITYRTLNMPEQITLYRYDWTSRSFTGGLLENVFAFEAEHQPADWLRLRGSLAFSLDGILLRGKSVVTPCWEAQLALHFQPAKWFEADVVLGHYRTRYTYRDMQFLSDDYMNGIIRYTDGTMLSTTGGAYHAIGKGLQQPAYFMLDIPFTFIVPTRRGSRHEFQVLSSVRKFYNTWTTRYADEASAATYTMPVTNAPYSDIPLSVHYMVPGERHYEVVPEPKYCQGHFFYNSPFVLTNDLKYTYTGRKTFVTISWQSYLINCLSALGNGVQQNDIGVLSESMANPNRFLCQKNMQQADPDIRRLGRADQDRGFIARIGFGWNITDNWGIAATAKFKDGTPFTNFGSALYNDNGHLQAAIWNANTRGTNTVDQHFGQRKDAYWGLDLRLRYRGAIKGLPIEAEIQCYNIWDFGNELVEYCFDYNKETALQVPSRRYAMELSVPRGLQARVTIGLERKDR